MTEVPAPAPEEPSPARSPWTDVLLTPLRGGALVGLILLAPIAYGLAWTEGGVGDDTAQRAQQAALWLAAILILGIYARRIAVATLQSRPVPWFGDSRDDASLFQALSSFAAVLVLALLPAMVLSTVLMSAGAPGWVSGLAAALGIAVGAIHLPYGLASSVLRAGGFGAGYAGTFRALRGNRDAAKIAVLPTAACLLLVALSVVLAQTFVKPYGDDVRPEHDHLHGRDLARHGIFVVRLAAFWAALCSFRVAGMLARDVPEVREALS